MCFLIFPKKYLFVRILVDREDLAKIDDGANCRGDGALALFARVHDNFMPAIVLGVRVVCQRAMLRDVRLD